MANDIVLSIWKALKGVLVGTLALWPVLLAAAFVLGGLWIALRVVDPRRAELLLSRSRGNWPRLVTFFASAAATALLSFGLLQAANLHDARATTVRNANASSQKAATSEPVQQSQPALAIVEERTYTRTITLPPEFLTRIGADGVGVLAPYLQDPSAEEVTRLVDQFRRSGANVVFTRNLTRRDERPIAFDATRIRTDFHGEGKGFRCEFNADYDFGNGLATPVEARITFALPNFGGTVSNFRLKVGDQEIASPDPRTGNFIWSGTLPPGDHRTAKVSYTVTGGKAFVYTLGSERRRTRDFTFTTTSDRQIRFGRYSLFPTSKSANGATWELKDVLTRGAIEMYFSTADAAAEGYAKTLRWLPVVLGLFALGAWWIRPERAVWATLAFGIGLLGVAVLGGYLEPVLATIAGLTIAAVLGAVRLASARGTMLAIGAALLGAVFLAVGHATLVAYLIGIVAIGALAFRPQRDARRLPADDAA